MTNVYFVRHAEPNYNNRDDKMRELTTKGLTDRLLVTNYLSDKNIDILLSSPYKRSIDTIKEYADKFNMEINIIDDFRERKADNVWIEDFDSFCMSQWNDFTYKLSDGESLYEVQQRNIGALNKILKTHNNKNIVVGSHGTALSTVINYYDRSFAYNEYTNIKSLFPFIAKFTFKETNFISVKLINLFSLKNTM